MNARDIDYATALHVTTRRRRVDVVRVLLEHGESADDKDGRTAFQVAQTDKIRNCCQNIVRAKNTVVTSQSI